MVSFNFAVYSFNRVTTFFINPTLSYNNLVLLVEQTFRLKSRHFILEIYDDRFKQYVEFDDEFINWLRNRLPRTSIETVLGRVILIQSGNRTIPQPSVLLPSTNFNRMRHQIVLLDKYMGVPQDYSLLKRQFYKTTSINHHEIDTISFTDIDTLICTDIDTVICTKNVLFNTKQINYLQAFEGIEECLNFINQTEFQPVIILITSNDFGIHIVPLLAHLAHVFVYILQNDWCQFEWGLDYLDRLQMFDHDQTLLIRITRDLALCYMKKAELWQKSELDLTLLFEALQYLRWARLLYERADHLDGTRLFSKRIDYIDSQIDKYQEIIDDRILGLNCNADSVSEEAFY